VGWRVVACPDLFKAIVFFIAFGLLMALTWVRLEAPDVALAEATIGAGLTGALLLSALTKLQSLESNPEFTGGTLSELPASRLKQGLAGLVVLLVAAGLTLSVISLPDTSAGLNPLVFTHLQNSGVNNPVTAVLLNYRAYDTLLEVIVLLVALLSVWSMNRASQNIESAPGAVLETLMKLLTPLLILVAAYLLWVGADAPGGAFQAGSIVAAAGVLLLLSGWRLAPAFSELPLRIVLVAGPVLFIAVALITLLVNGRLLQFPPAQAGLVIICLETVATISIGVTLAALFAGGRPHHKPPQP